jgi:hypothetical protein
MKGISVEPWFVGVVAVSASRDAVTLYEAASDADLMAILAHLGCSDIEPLDDGCANARIPIEWAKALKRDGGLTRRATLDGRRYLISIELP